jgi:hypothetical protein
MRLYTTTGATRVDDPVHGTFVVGDNDAFDFPNELSDRLHGMHVNKKAVWETDDERVTRVNEEQLRSVRDPAALYSAVREMSETQKGLSVGQNVLLAAVVKALGIDVPGVTAAPAAVPAIVPAAPPTPAAEAEDEESEEDPADDVEEPVAAKEPAKKPEPAAPAKKAEAEPAAKAAPVSVPGVPVAAEAPVKPARGARKGAAGSSTPSA